MAFAAARMILKDKRRKSKEDMVAPNRNRSKVFDLFTGYRLKDLPTSVGSRSGK